jgi:hypothetical protein
VHSRRAERLPPAIIAELSAHREARQVASREARGEAEQTTFGTVVA